MMKSYSILIILCLMFFVCEDENARKREEDRVARNSQIFIFALSGFFSALPFCSSLTPVTEVQTGQVITDANRPQTRYLLWKNIPFNAKMILTNNLTDPRCGIDTTLNICNVFGFYDPYSANACTNLGNSSFRVDNSIQQRTCILNSILSPNTGNSLIFNVGGSFFANNISNPCSYKLELTQ